MLGIQPHIELPQDTVTLAPGTLLVCYTDGVSECHDGQRFFDEDGIVSVVRAAGRSAEGVAADIERAARAWTPSGQVKDDMAILAVGVLA
jgi:serine phosphatase RsbU (regulator of sigma subunit)